MINFYIDDEQKILVSYNTDNGEVHYYKLIPKKNTTADAAKAEKETVDILKRQYSPKITREKKRANWRTINKISTMQADGFNSAQIAEKLRLPLEIVNKYWVIDRKL